MEELKVKEAEQKKDDNTKQTSAGGTEQEEGTEKNLKSQTSKSSSAEQDLDTFLLGDLEDSDGGPGIQPIHSIWNCSTNSIISIFVAIGVISFNEHIIRMFFQA